MRKAFVMGGSMEFNIAGWAGGIAVNRVPTETALINLNCQLGWCCITEVKTALGLENITTN